MPWTDDQQRFVVPPGMSEAEALTLRRILQVMSRLDAMNHKLDEIISILRTQKKERCVGEQENDNHGR